MDYIHMLIYLVSFIIHLAYLYDPMEIENVGFEFEKCGIVPDIIPVAPEKKIEIEYPDGAEISVGALIKPLQAYYMPATCYWENNTLTENGTRTTIVAFNPKFKANKIKISEWVNWIVVNIPDDNDVFRGNLMADYVGPLPPNDQKLHLYVFLVYKQRDKIKWDENQTFTWDEKTRAKFDITNFTQTYHLGDPIAGNFFYSRYDKTVPRLIRVMRNELEDYYETENTTSSSSLPNS